MQSRVALVLLVVVGLLAGCKKHVASPDAGATPIARPNASSSADSAFWQWFAANKDEVAKVKRADEPMADQLASHLHAIDGGLTFELGVATTEHELIISAAGIKGLFPVVKRVVAAAPPLPGWKIIAFRQRNSGISVELGDGTKLGGDAITFLPLGWHAGKMDVALFVSGVPADAKPNLEAVYLLLDATLGEYDVEMRLGKIEIKPASAAPPGTRPFRDLPGVVDAAPP